MNETIASRDPLAALRDPATIRARCAAVTRAVGENRSAHFTLDRSRLDEAARRVEAVTRERYPDLKIPYHSRWRHFEAGGVDRKAELDALLAGRSAAQTARARIDLTVVSVLLDAGAGADWSYAERPGAIDALALPVQRQQSDELLALLDKATGGAAVAADPAPAPAEAARVFRRSEGLAVASFRAFVGGAFSASKTDPLRADALALKRLDAAALRALFQAGPSNPLVGLEGRAALLSRLGEVLQAQAARDGGTARPGRLFDCMTKDAQGGTRTEVPAAELLRELLVGYAPIWRSGSTVQGLPAGDVWRHNFAGDACGAAAGAPGAGTRAVRGITTAGWVPFHKLSQWLTYSLLEPFEWAGVRVTGIDALTGLPEYRNGGLLLDTGVINPRDRRELERTWKPADDFIVEWRALTVTLLDELAQRVRARLGVSAEAMPLACILEGGTWAAGRQIAQELRGGAPPLQIDSDGTVF